MSDAQLAKQVNDDLQQILADVQGYCAVRCLAKQRPEQWIEGASLLLQGDGPRIVANKTGLSFYTVKTIQAQVFESPVASDLRRELAVRNLMSLETTVELSETIGAKLEKRLAEMTDEELKEISPLDLARMKREISTANKLDTDTLLKVRGDNVQTINVVHKTESYEDMMASVREARGEKVIEAEVINE